MIEAHVSKLQRAIDDPNLSSVKKAILQAGLDFLTTTPIGGVGLAPRACLDVLDKMLASVNSWDPLFLYTTNEALEKCNSTLDPRTKLFVAHVGNQNTFQINLVTSGLIEIGGSILTLSSMSRIDNAAIKVLWLLVLAILMLSIAMALSLHLQDNENRLSMQRNALSMTKEAINSPISTTVSFFTNWMFRGTHPIDTVAQGMQRGVVRAPQKNSSEEEKTRFMIGLTRKWVPISLHSVYDGLLSFAKQNIPATPSSRSNSVATLRR